MRHIAVHFRIKGPAVGGSYTDFSGREAGYYPRVSGGRFGPGPCCSSRRAHHHGVKVMVLAEDESRALSVAQNAMRQVWKDNFEYLRTDKIKDLPSVSNKGVSYMGEERLRRPAK